MKIQTGHYKGVLMVFWRGDEAASQPQFQLSARRQEVIVAICPARQSENRDMAKCYLPLKRLADIAAAVIMLLVLAPFFALVAIIMKLTDRGPIFFSQKRSGLRGEEFTICKFRTMRIDRKHDPFEYVSAEHSDITRLGRLLRRVKFDETPQIWNILKGDMSLIGPRPTLPEQVVKYNDFERRRLEVRPGCTGLAQIHGGITLSWPEKIKWDVYYVDRLGPMMDLRIFFKTFIVVLGGDKKFTRTIDQAGMGK